MSQPAERSVGYPFTLEVSAIALVIAQVLLSWFALDRLPSTVVPYFGLGGGALGLPAAEADARLWLWMVTGLWVMLFTASILMYRAIRTTPIPILSVAIFAFLAVLRAGAITLNLNPGASPKQALVRAIIVGIMAMLLGAVVERFRSRRELAPLLVGKSLYDERVPQGLSWLVVVSFGLGIPLLFIPSRVRVTETGVLVITAVSYFLIPASAIDRIERSAPLQALVGAGVNIAVNPTSAVRIFRKRRLLPIVFSVDARRDFIESVESLCGD